MSNDLPKESHRYQIIAQDFIPGSSRCLLIIEDKVNKLTARVPAEFLFNDPAILENFSSADIKMIGYIHAVEETFLNKRALN